MTTLQNDILEMYNALVDFSDNTVKTNFPTPIKVSYDPESRLLVFEQKGKQVYLNLPVYYCLGLDSIGDGKKKYTYLLPEDYDYLMSTFQQLISSGALIRERTCVSPENYGFDVYAININPREMYKGPDIIGQVRFISGTSWFFKFKVRHKYKL